MRPVLSLLALLALVTPALRAQDWAKPRLENSPRHLEWVKVKHGDREVNCFLGYPQAREKAPAVVVIHEIFGLSDWVRGVVDQLAEAGFIAIAPDLLSGMAPGGGGTPEFGGGDMVRRAVSGLPPDQVTADLDAVVAHVAALPASSGLVTVGGFCWGGSQTFRFATNNRKVKAAFVFYGSGPDLPAELARIECPVYGFYGSDDARVNATIPTSRELMERVGKVYEPVVYEGAGHGFMRSGEAPDATEANRKAREEAWKRWREVLRKL
ncbi:MAG: dienelactone hydrolase family protein [Verrucomicrobiae bacterium]|nr:dienelactone hydrolase family protein [Verrucomicrobiae bacterium]